MKKIFLLSIFPLLYLNLVAQSDFLKIYTSGNNSAQETYFKNWHLESQALEKIRQDQIQNDTIKAVYDIYTMLTNIRYHELIHQNSLAKINDKSVSYYIPQSDMYFAISESTLNFDHQIVSYSYQVKRFGKRKYKRKEILMSDLKKKNKEVYLAQQDKLVIVELSKTLKASEDKVVVFGNPITPFVPNLDSSMSDFKVLNFNTQNGAFLHTFTDHYGIPFLWRDQAKKISEAEREKRFNYLDGLLITQTGFSKRNVSHLGSILFNKTLDKAVLIFYNDCGTAYIHPQVKKINGEWQMIN